MAEHAQKSRQSAPKDTETAEQSDHDQDVAAAGLANPELSDDVDEMLAEIDDVLEENAELFVKSYVQKGGQ